MKHYILESSNEKRYKCPYCEKRLNRSSLISHIDKKHEELIPEGYSSIRIVFNLVNKKEHGNCVECRKETPWNDTLARYERFCIDNGGKCKDSAARRAKANMVKVYGKEHILDDMEHQQKMLANRSISGTYKFSKGGSTSYTGSYEKNFLEFLDSWGYRSIDIETPGPIIEYEYGGNKHKWITDLYLIPYNLVFDVKDGGSNPNTRNMEEYRAKQIAKEKAIQQQGVYNYIRLTDNDFSQLLQILADLKYQLLDPSNTKKSDKIIRINESIMIDTDSVINTGNTDNFDSVDSYIETVIGSAISGSDTYIIPYMMNNSFNVEYAISDNLTLEPIIISDDMGNITIKKSNFLKEECKNYKVFKFVGTRGDIENPSSLVELIAGTRILDPNQLLFSKDFKQVDDMDSIFKIAQECFYETIKSSSKSGCDVPIINESYLNDIGISYYKDNNGYFIKNDDNNLRSKSFSTINDIPSGVYKFVSKGIL